VKAQLLGNADVRSSRIKVITENGIVYLLGLVSQQEANQATAVVQGVAGVQKIVKLFEYID
jgi:osmotically-inducible protein OsmY